MITTATMVDDINVVMVVSNDTIYTLLVDFLIRGVGTGVACCLPYSMSSRAIGKSALLCKYHRTIQKHEICQKGFVLV